MTLSARYLQRNGYEFNGYWTTKYTEAEGADENGVKCHCYYSKQMLPQGDWLEESPNRTRLYAHWKYKIELDTNVYNSDNASALNKSSIGLDLNGYAKVGESVYSDSYGNTYTIATSAGSNGDDETLSVLAIDGAPVKLPVITDRTGYNPTQVWGVTQQICGRATDLFTLDNGYTVKDGAPANIAETNSAFEFTPGGDGINTVTLYADWAGKAKSYSVILRPSYAYGDDTFASSDADKTVTVTYDEKLSGDALFNPRFQSATNTATGAYDVLYFKGFYTQMNGVAKAEGADWNGTVYTQGVQSSANNTVTTTVSATDNAYRLPSKEADATAPAGSTVVEDGITYDARTGSVILFARWAYPVTSLTFDLQGGKLTKNGSVLTDDDGNPAGSFTIENAVSTHNPIPDLAELDAIPVRPGYKFMGYWTTKHTQDGTEHIGSNDVTAKRYYEAEAGYDPDAHDPTRSDAKKAVALKTDGGANIDWLSYDTEVTLYAQWEYKVYLDLNTVNSDSELVLNQDSWTKDDAGAWQRSSAGAKLDMAFDGSDGYQVEGDAASGAGTSLNVQDAGNIPVFTTRHYFTNLLGAPIALPQAVGREGYSDTRGWGTSAGAKGAATGIVSVDVTSGEAADDSEITDAFDLKGASAKYAEGMTLYANWRAGEGDALSGEPLTYKVTLNATYGGENGFAVAAPVPAAQTFDAEYDAPIPVDELISSNPRKLVPYADKAEDGSTAKVNYVDATIDPATNAARNLVLKGFYTEACEAAEAAGKAYIVVEDDAFTSKDVAFREVPLSGDAVNLYAWWAYNVMDLVFDLQGGTIDGKTAAQLIAADPDALTVSGVKSHDPVPRLGGIADQDDLVLYAAPQRDGYTFGGWWTTPYRENADVPDADLMVGGVKVTPAQYYTTTGDNGTGNVVPVQVDGEDIMLDAFSTTTTLYAHWVYTIEFDKNLTHNDRATVDFTAVADPMRQASALATATAEVPLTTDEATDPAHPEKDEFGNVFSYLDEDSGIADGGKDENEERTCTVRAIAGAPVSIPSAHSRERYSTEAHPTVWSATGYYPTNAWKTKDAGSAIALDSTAADSKAVSVEGGSWTTDAVSGERIPCAVGGTLEPPSKTVTLVAQWTPMVFDVQLVFSYGMGAGDDAISYADDVFGTEAGCPIIEVTYDAPVPSLADELTNVPESAIASVGAAPNQARHENLDLRGFRTSPNGFTDNSRASIGGVQYLNRSGVCVDAQTDKADDCQTFFQFVSANDLLYNSALHEGTAEAPAYPIKLYAEWAEPTRAVVFNLYNATSPDGSDAVEDATAGAGVPILVQKGDKLRASAVDGSYQTTALAALQRELDAVQSELNEVKNRYGDADEATKRADLYEFGGFWTHEWSEDPEESICYFAVEGGKLVGATDAWQESPAAGEATELYAHWKYRIAFNVNGKNVEGTADDQLALSTLPAEGHAPRIDLAGVPGYEGYVDAQGRATYGAPLMLPFGNDTEETGGTRHVGRMRDGEYAGYGFVAWLTDGDDPDSKIAPFADEAAMRTVPKTWMPQASNKTVELYASWLGDVYRIVFVNAPADLGLDETVSTWVAQPGTASISDVEVDVPLTIKNGESAGHDRDITTPALRGYTFKGYYTEPGGRGTLFYNASSKEGGTSAPEQNVPWRGSDADSPDPADPTGRTKIGYLYAHYEKDDYTVRFLTRDSDGTLQQVKGDSANLADQRWHYGDYLTAQEQNCIHGAHVEFPEVRFWRPGYTFKGWYYYPDEVTPKDGTAGTAVHGDASERAYVYAESDGAFRGGMFNADGTVTDYCTFDLEPGSSITLYAGWEPKEYTLRLWSNPGHGHTSTQYDELEVTYEQFIEPTDLAGLRFNGKPLLEVGSPFTFVGWNTDADLNADGTNAFPENGGWLMSYTDPGAPVRMGLDSEGEFTGGRFMPQGSGVDASAFDYHAIWRTPDNKTVTFYEGAHGAFSTSVDADDDGKVAATLIYSLGLSLADGSRTPVADPGWTFRGWVPMTKEQMEAYGGDTDRLNAQERSLADIDSRGGIYPATNAAHAHADHWFVAAYELTGSYSVTLDFGDRAKYENVRLVQDVPAAFATGSAKDADGAALVDDSHTAYNKTFNTERPVYGGDSGTTIVGYEPEAPFALPTDTGAPAATCDGYTLKGWYVRMPGDDASTDYSQRELYAASSIDPVAFARAVAETGQPADLVLVAAWEETTYRIVFDAYRYENAVGSGSGPTYEEEHLDDGITLDVTKATESEVWEDVPYTAIVTLPQPATRAGGQAFSGWSLSNATHGADTFGGSYAAGASMSVKDIVSRIEGTPGAYVFAFGDPAARSLKVSIGPDNAITLYAHWDETISATMPLQVLVSIDPDSGDMLAADAYLESRFSRNGAKDLEVASLRYDAMEAEYDDGAKKATFGLDPDETAAGKAVYLSVYANRRGIDLGKQNVVDLSKGVLAGDSYEPLLIDLNERSMVFPKADPFASPSTVGPEASSANLDRVQTLTAKGFDSFGYGDDRMDIAYGLAFKGFADASEAGKHFRDEKKTLPGVEGNGRTFPIARLYYTIARSS